MPPCSDRHRHRGAACSHGPVPASRLPSRRTGEYRDLRAGRNSSMRTMLPAEPKSPWKQRSTQRCASSTVIGHQDALARCQPVCLDHIRTKPPEMVVGRHRLVEDSRLRGWDPGASMTCFAYDLEDSSRAAARVGPNTGMPRGPGHRSARPPAAPRPYHDQIDSLGGGDGGHRPDVGRLDPSIRWPSVDIPGLPGSSSRSPRLPLRRIAQASACSRPPPPTSSALMPSISSAGAPAPPISTPREPRRAPRSARCTGAPPWGARHRLRTPLMSLDQPGRSS